MLTGDEIKRSRQRAGWSQEELARRVGSTHRTVGNWERGTNSPNRKESVLRDALAGYLDADVHGLRSSLSELSDVELLGELARRLGNASNARTTREKEVGDDEQRAAPKSEAGDLPAQDDYGLAADDSHHEGDYGMIAPDEIGHDT